MIQYHKIKTLFKRDPDTKDKTLLLGQYTLPEFKYLEYNEWTFTEKIDGMCITVIWDGQKITFAGKSKSSVLPGELNNRLKEIFIPKVEFFKKTFPNVIVYLYGEGYGGKIQKGGGNYAPDQDFVLFDVLMDGWWYGRYIVEDIADNIGIKSVPVVGIGTLEDMAERVHDGFESKWGNFIAEGIVARPYIELRSRGGDRIITKLKYRDFIR
ncbi:MAG TPA: hypothetical protein ENG87_05385 [Candidatus Pacearchaeota archaeon]|nr:hypothetical protein [Candidatus Pacearchaeota archaeon]